MVQRTDRERWAFIRQEVARACAAAGRAPESVRLVCITKTIDAARIEPVIAAGCRDFGENRVQEARLKWPSLLEAAPDRHVRLVGPLQTNKVADAVALFSAIESLDRPKLAAALASEIERQGAAPALLVQVNIGAEAQKSGVPVDQAVDFVKRCRNDHGLTIAGLMCVPPLERQAAPYFALLGKLAERAEVSELSMGMSADFREAIQLGATEIRVGSAIFART